MTTAKSYNIPNDAAERADLINALRHFRAVRLERGRDISDIDNYLDAIANAGVAA